VATAGFERVRLNGTVFYDFPTWARRIEKGLAPHTSVSQLSRIVEDKSRETFSDFDVLIKRGQYRNKDNPLLVKYFVAGYESGAPVVNDIETDVDWERNSLVGPKLVQLYPKNRLGRNLSLYGKWSVGGVKQLMNRESDTYKKAVSKLPFEIQALNGDRYLSLDQAVRLIRFLLAIEAEANANKVGPPFKIITISRDGRTKVQTLPQRAFAP